MGSHQFQMEYIEYLQERNSELASKLSEMKENYESKLFNRHFRNYHTSLVDEILKVCTSLPQEIDVFFNEMTAAMNTLKNILLKKSEMVQLVNKISKEFQSPQPINEENCSSEHSNSNLNSIKKSGTAKVSPMINGHVISTEPRIYLNRLSTPTARIELQQLSPIVETSPSTSDNSILDQQFFKEPTVILERLDLSELPVKQENTLSQNSLFKTWKNNLLSKKEHSNLSHNSIFLCQNKKKKELVLNKEKDIGAETNKNEIDPLEGPSWLYNNNNHTSKPSPDHGFVDYRRRKHRFAVVFDNNKEVPSVGVKETSEKKQLIDKPTNVDASVTNDEKTFVTCLPSPTFNTSELDSENECSSEYIAETPRNKSKIKSEMKDVILKSLKKPVISLHDCLAEKTFKNSISLKSSLNDEGEKISDEYSMNKTSSSQNTIASGRKKRKAAPTNLTEPSLGRKLRRD